LLNGGYVSCEVNASVNQVDPKLPSVTQVEPQELPNPLGISDVNQFIARVINFVLGLIGSVSLLMFIYGGLTWMTSAGAADKIKKGRDIIVWSVIGLAIVFTAYIMVKFVIQSLAG
jgi:fumarate reductase subunit D